MIFQTTIAETATLDGNGLHTGAPARVVLRPAPADNGVVFRRRVNGREVSIPAISANVVHTRFATVLGCRDQTVSTVEHFLAALSGCRIDNLWVDIDGPEIPIQDGSALPYVRLLQNAGIHRLDAPRKYLSILKPVSVVEKEKRVSIIPSRFFRISFEVAFDHPAVPPQSLSFKYSPEYFYREIAPARTFGFLDEVEQLKARGLARGGTLKNAVVFDDKGVVNPEGLRFPDEVVRHKILDAMGDFRLLGYPVLGHLRSVKGGHEINLRLVNKILASPDCWKLVEVANEDAQRGAVPHSALASNFL